MLCVRRDNKVVMAGDGQVTLGHEILKSSARKLRRLYNDRIVAGFAGSTADACVGVGGPVPVVARLEEAASRGADTLALGIAPAGGRLVPLTGQGGDAKAPVSGGFVQPVDLVRGPGDSALHTVMVTELAVVVVEPVLE